MEDELAAGRAADDVDAVPAAEFGIDDPGRASGSYPSEAVGRSHW